MPFDWLSRDKRELFLQDTLQSHDLGAAYAKGWNGYVCAFVLSSGRVGTETLTALLNLSESIIALHEPVPRLIQTSFDAYMNESGASSYCWKKVIYAARDDYICKAHSQNKIYVETSNRMTYLAGYLAQCFPDARFIHLHRHPYDVIRSGMRRGYYQGHGGDFARIRPREGDVWFPEWEGFSTIEKIAWYWHAVNKDAMDFCDTLPEAKSLVLAAEDMFQANGECLERLFGFMAAEMPSIHQIDKVLGKKMNAQRSGKCPDISTWDDAQLRRVKAIISDTASRLGYDI